LGTVTMVHSIAKYRAHQIGLIEAHYASHDLTQMTGSRKI
jgi:hypothetical protein